jgi:two-component system, OmpR family, phosphate regulon sensor histidine kinase PhoR
LKSVPTRRPWKSALRYSLLCFFCLLALDVLLGDRMAHGSSVLTDAALRILVWVVPAALIAAVAGPILLREQETSRRIRELQQFAQRMNEQEFPNLPHDLRHDELAALRNALNEVAAQYDRTIRLLTEERNRSDTILRSMVEGVAVIEAEQKIAFSNEAFCQALGLQSLPCAGRLLVEVTRESGLLEIVQQTRATRRTAINEIEIKGSPPRTFSVTSAPVQMAKTTGVVLVLHDISELRKLERMRRDFVANVSHEFKTPLTAIQGFSETLLEGALEDKQNSRRFLEIIRGHAVRLGRVTSDLLKLSMIEAGRLELEKQPLAVPDLVNACVETLRMKAAKKEIALAADCAPDLPTITADAGRLREALLNLMDNALQYTPDGGAISVKAAWSGSELVIAVQDNGIGIPKADQERIFERFYRVDDARSREVGGTGLGLSITRHLIEAHGGRIDVESEVGRGSTFSIHLPIS